MKFGLADFFLLSANGGPSGEFSSWLLQKLILPADGTNIFAGGNPPSGNGNRFLQSWRCLMSPKRIAVGKYGWGAPVTSLISYPGNALALQRGEMGSPVRA